MGARENVRRLRGSLGQADLSQLPEAAIIRRVLREEKKLLTVQIEIREIKCHFRYPTAKNPSYISMLLCLLNTFAISGIAYSSDSYCIIIYDLLLLLLLLFCIHHWKSSIMFQIWVHDTCNSNSSYIYTKFHLWSCFLSELEYLYLHIHLIGILSFVTWKFTCVH